MKEEEIIRILGKLGLSYYESKAYAALVFLGPSKASIISEESGVTQSRIYDILSQLMNKQLVEVFRGRPKEYKAVRPAVALRQLLAAHERRLKLLKRKVSKISSLLKPQGHLIEGIWTTKSKKRKEFFNKTAEMLYRSRKYVYGVSRDYSRSATLADAVKSCLRRNVKIKLIGMEPINEENYYKAKWYKDLGIDIRIFETKIHPRIVVIDGREVLIRLDHNPRKKERFRFNSIWSQDPSLVYVIDTYVKNLWQNAKPVNFNRVSTSI
jgi:sugar-specific transcriptional regulator TrmB